MCEDVHGYTCAKNELMFSWKLIFGHMSKVESVISLLVGFKNWTWSILEIIEKSKIKRRQYGRW